MGEAYEINNQKVHSVMNKGAEDRINFIFDYVPPGAIPGRVASPASPEARGRGLVAPVAFADRRDHGR